MGYKNITAVIRPGFTPIENTVRAPSWSEEILKKEHSIENIGGRLSMRLQSLTKQNSYNVAITRYVAEWDFHAESIKRHWQHHSHDISSIYAIYYPSVTLCRTILESPPEDLIEIIANMEKLRDPEIYVLHWRLSLNGKEE